MTADARAGSAWQSELSSAWMTKERVFSFGASVRLKKGWEFDAVFRTGRQQRGELVRLYYLHRPGEPSKIGVTVGKKIAGAVGRSHGRRLMREALRRIIPWLVDGVWLVASMRERGLKSGADEVYFDLAKLLDRASLLESGWTGPDWRVDAPCLSAESQLR